MAIKLTREEYEKQYGEAPNIVKSNIDTTPAPIRMTRAEYDSLYRKAPQTSSQERRQDFEQMREAQNRTVREGTATQQRIIERQKAGEISTPKALFQRFGAGLQTSGRALFDTAIGGAKMLLPQSAEDTVKQGVARAGEELVKRTTEEFSEMQQRAQSGDEDAQKAVEFIEEVKLAYQTDETFRDDVNAAGGILEWVALPGAKRVAKPIVETTAGITEQVVKKTPEIFSVSDTKLVNNRAAAIADIENKYANLRNLNNFSDDGGAASRQRIAQTDVLVNAVDSDGVIRTKGANGAVERYREATIGGMEDVVRKNLEAEGKTVSIPELRNRMVAIIYDSGLEGADLQTALNGINREIKGLSIRSDSVGQIPLAKLQDAKINTTKNINFNTPPETATYRKALARAYKEIIELKSDFNVKEVNAELAKYYKDIERLEALDGKRVKGGKLGKYFAGVTGNVVGGVAGSVGGSGGAAVGAILGGEIAERIQSAGMRSTFGTGGKPAPSNPVLDVARRTAETKTRALDVPDQAIGLPDSTKRLLDEIPNDSPLKKEALQVERAIKKNVADQKTAIKNKDFALVSALKDVYTALVEELKRISREVIEFTKENYKDQGGFANFFGGDTPNQRKNLKVDQSTPTSMPNNASINESVPDATPSVKTDVEDSIVLENLMRLDPIDVDPIDSMRLDELKRKAERQPLTEDELLEARAIVENSEGSLPKADMSSATTKTTDLLEEARKYESVDQFIKSRGEVVYHGSPNADKIKELKAHEGQEGYFGNAVYLTRDMETAKRFTKLESANPTLESMGDGRFMDINTGEVTTGGKPDVLYVSLPKNLKLKKITIDEMGDEIEQFRDSSGRIDLKAARNAVRDKYFKEGYDGFDVPATKYFNEPQVVIFPQSQEKIKLTTQLAEIWKKANQE